jgi:hypothetical protein
MFHRLLNTLYSAKHENDRLRQGIGAAAPPALA